MLVLGVSIMAAVVSCNAPPLHQGNDNSRNHRYVAANCDFAVYFPSEPRVRTLSNPELGSYEEAGLVSGDVDAPAMLRTECIPVFNNLTRLGGPAGAASVLREQLNALASAAGLANVQISVEQTSLGPTGMLQGTKTVGGRAVIYQMRAIAGPNSNLNLYAGGDASSFPQPGMMEFLNSAEPAIGGGN